MYVCILGGLEGGGGCCFKQGGSGGSGDVAGVSIYVGLCSAMPFRFVPVQCSAGQCSPRPGQARQRGRQADRKPVGAGRKVG